jgi:hypothetical protein
MPNWMLKAMVQRGLGMLPKPHFWNELFQKHVTHSLGLEAAKFEFQLQLCRRCLEEFRSLRSGTDLGFNVFELGTGWYPSLPIGLQLCGAAETWTCDIVPLLRRERLRTLLTFYRDYHDEGQLAQHLPALRPERVEKIREMLEHVAHESPQAVLARLNIHAMVRDA